MDMSVQKHLSASTAAQSRPAIAEASRKLVSAYTCDQNYTFDMRTLDSTGAFMVGELERLDQTANEPLVEFTWSRDIFIRSDVTAADEVASFTNMAFAMAGGINPQGINWVSHEGNAIAGPSLDIAKTPQAMRLWAAEVKCTVPELVQSQQLGRPIDASKVEAMNLKRNIDLDRLVYLGDSDEKFGGLINSDDKVGSVSNVQNGAKGTPQWRTKTADEILRDVNDVLTSAWGESGWKVMPNRLLLPPDQYGYIAQAKVSEAGNMSILTYVLENNISARSGTPLDILPLKWLVGAGDGGTPMQLGTVDRMVAYNRDKKYVQYPMTELQLTPVQFRSLFQIVVYWARFGQVEFRYGTTVAYRDGI